MFGEDLPSSNLAPIKLSELLLKFFKYIFSPDKPTFAPKIFLPHLGMFSICGPAQL